MEQGDHRYGNNYLSGTQVAYLLKSHPIPPLHVIHGETKAQKGEVTGLDHMEQMAEGGGHRCCLSRWWRLGGEAWVSLRVGGLSLPPLWGLLFLVCARSEAGPDRWDSAEEESSESEGPLSS